MATKMKTGRMTVKTTTKPNGGGGRTQDEFKKMSAADQYKEWSAKERREPQYDYTPGIGRKAGGLKLTPSELEEFNKQNAAKGYNMRAKEVRYAKGDEGVASGVPRQYQVFYADPNKEKQYYKTTNKVTPNTIQKTPEKVSVGSLATKKLSSPTIKATLKTAPKKKEMVSKAIEGPSGKGRQMKNNPRVSGPFQSNKLTKTDLNIKGQIAGAKFRKEQKMAGAYERTRSLADENQGPNVWAGAFSKEKKAGYQAMRKDLKAARKETGVNVRSAVKDTRLSQKFEKKEQVGKTRYFTKAKLSETVEKKPGMKGKMQAGKMRYK